MKKESNEETKICKDCGKELPLTEFRVSPGRNGKIYHGNICLDCYRIRHAASERKRRVERKKPKPKIVFERKYKTIDKKWILDMSKSRIPLIAEDEYFTYVMDSSGYYLSNYGRMIHVTYRGRYLLLKGHRRGTEEHYYTIVVNKYVDGKFADIKIKP